MNNLLLLFISDAGISQPSWRPSYSAVVATWSAQPSPERASESIRIASTTISMPTGQGAYSLFT